MASLTPEELKMQEVFQARLRLLYPQTPAPALPGYGSPAASTPQAIQAPISRPADPGFGNPVQQMAPALESVYFPQALQQPEPRLPEPTPTPRPADPGFGNPRSDPVPRLDTYVEVLDDTGDGGDGGGDGGGGGTGGGGTGGGTLEDLSDLDEWRKKNPGGVETPEQIWERKKREETAKNRARKALGLAPGTPRQGGGLFDIGRVAEGNAQADISAFLGKFLPERAGNKIKLLLNDFRYGLITKFKRGMRPIGSLEDVNNFLINKSNGALVLRHGYTEHITGTITDISAVTTLSSILEHKQVTIERPFSTTVDVLAVNSGTANGTFFQKPFFHNSSSGLQRWVDINEKRTTTISGAPSGNTFVLAAGSASDDYYNGWTIRNTTRSQSLTIVDYVGSSKTVTVHDDLPSGWVDTDAVVLARYFHDEVGDFTNDWGSIFTVSTANPNILQTGESYIACGGRTASAEINVLPYRSEYLDKTFFAGTTTNSVAYRYQGTYASKMHVKSDLGFTYGNATETSPGGTGLDANKRYFYKVVYETDDGQLSMPVSAASNYLTPSTTGKGLSFTVTIHYPMMNKRIRFLNVFLGETDKTAATSLPWKDYYFVRQFDLVDNTHDDGGTSVFAYTGTSGATPAYWSETVELDDVDWSEREENLLEHLGVPGEFTNQSVPFNRATTVNNILVVGDYYDQVAEQTVPDGLAVSVPASGAGVPQINQLPNIDGYTRSLVAAGDPAKVENVANYQGNLFVLKTNACYQIDVTSDPTTWALKKIAAIGCDSPRTVVVTPFGVCWVNSGDDIYIWSGGYPKSLTNNTIQPTFRELVIPDNLSPWTARSASEANIWSSVAWSPELGLFAAVSTNGTNRVMTSPDGITWTARSASEANSWIGIVWSPELGLFAAISYDGTNRVMTSPDGITWTARAASEANAWVGIAWSPELGLFAAVSSSGTNQVMTSPDGITWTARAEAEANSWESIAWSPALGLFVAAATDGTNRVMTSPNGITWTARSASEANQWSGIAWSPELGLFAAVSYDGTNRVMTSPDGITWTARSASEANQWAAIAWSPELGLFVAVSYDGTNRVMTSPDGITWTARVATENSSWEMVVWSPELGLFAAVSSNGSNRVMTAYGLNTWHSYFDQTTKSYNFVYDDLTDRKTVYSTSFEIPVLGNFAWTKHRFADSINTSSINYLGEPLLNTGTEVMRMLKTATDDAGTAIAPYFDTGDYTLDEKDLVALYDWYMAVDQDSSGTWAGNLDVQFLMNGTTVTLGGTNPLTGLTKTKNFFRSLLPLDVTAIGRRIRMIYNSNASKATFEVSDSDETPLTILEVGIGGEARTLHGSEGKQL